MKGKKDRKRLSQKRKKDKKNEREYKRNDNAR